MEFSTVIPDATKNVVLTRVIGELELEIYEKCKYLGVDLAGLAADYAAPAEPEDSDGDFYLAERMIASLNTRIVNCKAELTALG